jgi:4-hydroxybutyryl-CoA dehydratase / vinylacetyl-CoA-Delta-isomerase
MPLRTVQQYVESLRDNRTNANELIVLPARALAEADRDYAVSFAVPLATPGLTLLASAYDLTAPQASPVEHPISARHKMMESTTVFEDVFVPWERVAVSYKLPLVDALIGGAMLMAD